MHLCSDVFFFSQNITMFGYEKWVLVVAGNVLLLQNDKNVQFFI